MQLPFLNKNARPEDLALDALTALKKTLAIIEFLPNGTVITANENFLTLMGYTLGEVQGQHHSMFLASSDVSSQDYDNFWRELNAGVAKATQFKRISKAGAEIRIEGSYNPLIDQRGKVYRIVKVAKDVTSDHARAADDRGQLAAISRSQAVIEFDLNGVVLTANENFCAALGYNLAEIVGRNHRLFVDSNEANSASYADFWRTLKSGKFFSAEYRRLGKAGNDVWIQASYNPIFDANGRPYKVVKYATDITERKMAFSTLSEALETLAQGDLTCSVEQVFPVDLEPVRDAFNQTVRQFSSMVSELKQTSTSLRTATGEILAGANDLADRTTRQAAAVEETTATVDTLTMTVTDNAALADGACATARQVSEGAVKVGEVMVEANAAMEAVSVQAAKISNIIGMIDDIAFQTNLLALNASVEAARAGDAGKGFAVVAVEVRRLAQSAARASRDVKELIEESNVAVALGSKLVASATDRLSSIVSSVQESAALMQGVSTANREQATSLIEVNAAVRQLDEMTQHNAALVEETNAAIEQTEGQASRLDLLVERFRVTDDSVLRRAGLAPTQMRTVAPRAGNPNQKRRVSG